MKIKRTMRLHKAIAAIALLQLASLVAGQDATTQQSIDNATALPLPACGVSGGFLHVLVLDDRLTLVATLLCATFARL